jgi:threonine/homoserine/homoserine lactone efflux protein
MTLIFCTAFIAGLAYCAAPGVINAEGIRRGLNHGFRSSMLFQTGALAGDAFWAIVALSGIAVMPSSGEVRFLLGTGGGLLMVWMAWGIVRASWKGYASLPQPKRDTDVFLGALLSITNPFAVLFWLGVGGGLVMTNTPVSPLLSVAVAVGAIVLANLLWIVALASVATYGRRLVCSSAFGWINAGAGVCMALCGVALCWQSVAALAS